MVIKYNDIVHENVANVQRRKKIITLAFNIMNIAFFYSLYYFFGLSVFSVICLISLIISAICSIFIVLGVNFPFIGVALMFPNFFNPINYPLWIGMVFSSDPNISLFCTIWFSYALLSTILEVVLLRRNRRYKEVLNSAFKRQGAKYIISASLGSDLLSLSPIKRDTGFFWYGWMGRIQKGSVILTFGLFAISYMQMTQESTYFPYTFAIAMFIFGTMARPMAVQLLAGPFAIFDFVQLKRKSSS